MLVGVLMPTLRLFREFDDLVSALHPNRLDLHGFAQLVDDHDRLPRPRP
jgi:uncharacterized protein YdcH (DUF465 family)